MKLTVNNIFITGVTGVVGGRLLVEILSSTQAMIYCLVRGEDIDKAWERIEAIHKVYDPQKLLYHQLKLRVVPVLGDVSKAYLGLGITEYGELAKKIDLTIHCAANINLFASYKAVKTVNLGGTARIVKLCQGGGIPLVYVSTFTVLGDKVYEDGFLFKETDLDVNQSFENLNYQRSKFEAEKLIRRAGDKGLRYLILRLGNIFGDSVTGSYPLQRTNVVGAFYEILKGVVETGVSPFLDGENFDITPVDYAAKAILSFSLESSAYYRTFHLTNPWHRFFFEIINMLIEYGYRIHLVSFRDFVAMVRSHRIIKDGKVYHSSFTNMISVFSEEELDLFEKARFDTTLARKFLETVGIECPKPDISLFKVYLDFCVKIGYLPPPKKQKLAEILPPKT